MLHLCEVWMVQQSVKPTGRSSVSVFKTNLLPYSLKHTHMDRNTLTCTQTCTHPDATSTNTHISYSFNLFSFVCRDEKASVTIRMDGQRRGQIAKGGKKRVDVYIIHAGINALFVTAATSTSISPPAFCLLSSLGSGNAMNLCVFVCVSDIGYSLGQISDQSRLIWVGSSNWGQRVSGWHELTSLCSCLQLMKSQTPHSSSVYLSVWEIQKFFIWI